MACIQKPVGQRECSSRPSSKAPRRIITSIFLDESGACTYKPVGQKAHSFAFESKAPRVIPVASFLNQGFADKTRLGQVRHHANDAGSPSLCHAESCEAMGVSPARPDFCCGLSIWLEIWLEILLGVGALSGAWSLLLPLDVWRGVWPDVLLAEQE